MAEFSLISGVREIDPKEWNDLVGDESPFLEWEWLASMEDAGAVGEDTGWLPRPLVARENGRLVAACPVYIKGHSEGEFVFDYAWADAAYRAGIRYYPKLLVGVPFTPVTGSRFLIAQGLDRSLYIRQIGEILQQVCEEHGFSSVHVNFCRPDEIAPLEEAGFAPRVGVQYHWANRSYGDFADYLSQFRSKRRNQIQRERRAMADQGITLDTLVGSAIPDDLFDPLFTLYLSTIEKYPWGRQYLNRRFFDLLAQRFRHRLCVVIARERGEIVGGAFNVQKGDGLFGRYWGCIRELRYLHFNVCYYAGVEHSIAQKIRTFEPGAGGQYKQLRGFDAAPTFSAHYLTDTRLRSGVEHFLEAERADAHDALRVLKERSALKAPVGP